ncbi:uncharacterized protein N7446_005243 [Penicillium canescens]|uniref:Uncharacterized protein n=1 Tax=Penicillium canescens TaxID=5083 RepID=A0AAD6I9F7_PENCN|nr:uncharacterized protein N7446_005243 [Penicillium canescens]KAJ6038442.1 hypothetical protein N7460_008213 [Penicillium canescens]KAJ6068206.1 hypothetical protein N7446_005243 [Penicillium canescens]
MIAKSKVAPEMLPNIIPTTWLDKARDARELSIVNSATAVFVAIVGIVLVSSTSWLLVTVLDVLKSKSSD